MPNSLRPFRQSTRQRVKQVATFPIALGTQQVVELPRTGFLSKIIISVYGTLNLSGIGVLSAYNIYNLFRRLTLNVNTGQAKIFDCSGFGTYIVNSRMTKYMHDPISTDLAAVATAAGANPFYFNLEIPVAMGEGLNFDLGLFNLQAPEVRTTLDVVFAGSGADISTNFTSITNGFVQISYEYYEVPDPRNTAFPPRAVNRFLEDRVAITAVGDISYTVPRNGALLQLSHVVTLNDKIADLRQGQSNSNLIDNVRLELNGTDTILNVPGRNWAMRQAKLAGSVGLSIDYNFMDAGVTGLGDGDNRDWFDSDAVSEMKSIITVNAGATIGTKAYLDVIRHNFQMLAE